MGFPCTASEMHGIFSITGFPCVSEEDTMLAQTKVMWEMTTCRFCWHQSWMGVKIYRYAIHTLLYYYSGSNHSSRLFPLVKCQPKGSRAMIYFSLFYFRIPQGQCRVSLGFRVRLRVQFRFNLGLGQGQGEGQIFSKLGKLVENANSCAMKLKL